MFPGECGCSKLAAGLGRTSYQGGHPHSLRLRTELSLFSRQPPASSQLVSSNRPTHAMLSMQPFFWHPQRPKTSADVFQVEQQLWAVLARDRASYWRDRRVEPRGQESGQAPLYTSLDKEKKEIGLLQVTHLARPDGEPRFAARLMQVALEDNPIYISISYAWGEQSVALQAVVHPVLGGPGGRPRLGRGGRVRTPRREVGRAVPDLPVGHGQRRPAVPGHGQAPR